MAHSNQARKRIRQNEKRRIHNKAKSSAMKTYMKRLADAVRGGDRSAAEKVLVETCKHIDKAAKTNVIHKNTAARRKGQLMRLVAKMGGGAR
jgi:small subunit ribosomal protein S20